MKNNIIVLLLLTLAGCGYMETREMRKERADRNYRAAMESYQAGRLAEAIEGLKSVCRANPANSSARFQLACLLQDSRHAYLDAACAYREYLMQQPESEKSSLAKSRYAECEKLLALELASKYNLNSTLGLEKQLSEMTAARKTAEESNQKLEKELTELRKKVAMMQESSKRLREVIQGSEDDAGAIAKDAQEAVKAMKSSEQQEEAPKVTASDIAAAKSLLDEEESNGTTLLTQPEDAKAKRAAAEKAKREAEEAAKATKENEPQRPKFYIVQEGDSLYKIAARFYGHNSAWKKIRDANKAIVSSDGRVQAGQKLVLP